MKYSKNYGYIFIFCIRLPRKVLGGSLTVGVRNLSFNLTDQFNSRNIHFVGDGAKSLLQKVYPSLITSLRFRCTSQCSLMVTRRRYACFTRSL